MSAMTFKGYAAKVEYDADDGIFTGRIAGIADIVGFHADTVEDLRAAFHEAVEDYVEACSRTVEAPRKPSSSGNRGQTPAVSVPTPRTPSSARSS